MSKTKSTIIIGLILISVAFYGGFRYGQTGSSMATTTSQFAGRGARGIGGNMVRGEIIKKDAQSITIALPTSGSQIVWYSTSTAIQKIVTGKTDDLVIGQTVIVNGSANSDGSLTAQSIQLR